MVSTQTSSFLSKKEKRKKNRYSRHHGRLFYHQIVMDDLEECGMHPLSLRESPIEKFTRYFDDVSTSFPLLNQIMWYGCGCFTIVSFSLSIISCETMFLLLPLSIIKLQSSPPEVQLVLDIFGKLIILFLNRWSKPGPSNNQRICRRWAVACEWLGSLTTAAYCRIN